MITMRAAVILLALFIVGAPQVLSDYQVIQMNYIGVATIVALGLVLLTGVAGVMSFGQQVFAGLAAYSSAVLSTQFGAPPWIGLAVGLALVAVVSMLLGVITLRLSGHYLPIATIAWGIAIYFLFGNLDILGKHTGLQNIPPISIGNMSLDTGDKVYFLIWAFAFAFLLAASNLLDSRSGRALRALRSRAVMAESFGIDTTRLKNIVFWMAALLAGVSGWLYAHFQGVISPSAFSVHAGIDYLFMVIIGGAGSVWGALAGATIFTLLKEKLADWLPVSIGSSGNYEIVILGAVILLLLHRTATGVIPVLARWILKKTRRELNMQCAPLPKREQPQEGTVLTVSKVTKRFGGLVAVREMSFDMEAREILGLIGPNGAGKSTMFNMITGVLHTDAGEIHYRGDRINNLLPSRIAPRGIARTFQHVNLIGNMTVLDNVAIGTHMRGQKGMLAAMLRMDRSEEERLLAEAARQIARVGLAEHMHDLAGSLPLGKQRLVEIARALCADPTLLLLDEPAAGLRYAEKKALAKLLRQLRAEGMGILLVEHDMEFVMGLVDRLVVMQFGERLAEGLPHQIQSNPAVVEAYLGSAA